MSIGNGQTVIIEIGAEGGSIKVLARTGADGKPEYCVMLRDQTFTFLAEDEAGNVIKRNTEWTESWDDAVAALGRWPWPRLSPRYVDPEYRARVLAAAREYMGRDGRPVDEAAIGN